MGNFFCLNPEACITVDFKKVASHLFYPGSTLLESIKNEAIRIAPKHNNSVKTFPYAIEAPFNAPL